MTNQRIGNDIRVKWALVLKGTSDPFILSGKNVSLYLRGVTGKKKIEDFSVAGNTITWTFYGKDQKHTGVYSLILVVNEGVEGMVTTDACNFVNLVSCSCKTGGSDDCGVYTETIELTSTIEYVAGEGGSYDDTEIRNQLTELSAELGEKQDTITDLDAIREGAAKGATALQRVPEGYATKEELNGFLKAAPQILSAEQKAVVRNNLGIDDYITAVLEGSINDAINGEY